MTEAKQDLFISHAGADKPRFVQPMCDKLAEFGVTFWLDNIEVSWGDNIPMKINEGLRDSNYVLLCLSPSFLRRPWTETEMSAAFAMQTRTGAKRVLPLILEQKQQILEHYPILSSLAYREFTKPDETARSIAEYVGKDQADASNIRVVVESVHSGTLCNIRVSPTASVKWLSDKAQHGLGVSENADTGAYVPFRVRWVLVDTRAEELWLELPRATQRTAHAVILEKGKLSISRRSTDSLTKVGVQNGMVFHLYAIEDEFYPPPAACPPG